jgi:uncharacterized membrane protein YeaQ/YmgE (transglycosylase-associated protein family)
MGWFIVFLLIGLIAGFLARLLVPGKDPMGFFATLLLGILGSLLGGFLGYIIFNKDVSKGAFQTSGLFGSIIGAVILLLIWRWWKGHHASAAHHRPTGA